MKQHTLVTSSMMSLAATIVLAGTAYAGQGDWSEIRPEINACVAAVSEHADYADATRVRHAVVDIKERTVGYKLTIQTSIFAETGDAAIREYATSCVVNGDHTPMQFSIVESGNDA